MPRSERLYLVDIIEAAREIDEYGGGLSYDEFEANRMCRHAVLQLLTEIGEAAAHISDEVRQRYPEIEWADIIGFRNRAVHASFAVDWDIVWVAATEDTALLARQVAAILAREYPSSEPSGKE